MSADNTSLLSFVIPVYNAGLTIEAVVHETSSMCEKLRHEIVLVNDGSTDDSEAICRRLVQELPDTVNFIQLSRNFGEHNAVMAGLRYSRGDYVVIVDDDGQHPPSEALRLYEGIRTSGVDVMYGRYAMKQHTWLRNLGSWTHNQLATRMLGKPRGLYLSSFKVLNRFVVDALNAYENPPPYIDGLIFRITQNVDQMVVTHRERLEGQSNYDLRRLVSLWLGIFLDFSTLPLRVAGLLGIVATALSSLLLLFILIDKLWLETQIPMGIPTVLGTIVFFGGVQLLILGVFGEYLARLFVTRLASPLYVVRYTSRGTSSREG